MDQVKQMVESGVRVSTAVREALAGRGLTVRAFAIKYDLPLTTSRASLYGNLKPSERLLAALIAELGGTAEEWAELLWLAGKPASTDLASLPAKLAANQ